MKEHNQIESNIISSDNIKKTARIKYIDCIAHFFYDDEKLEIIDLGIYDDIPQENYKKSDRNIRFCTAIEVILYFKEDYELKTKYEDDPPNISKLLWSLK